MKLIDLIFEKRKDKSTIAKKFIDFTGKWDRPDIKHIKGQLELAACTFDLNIEVLNHKIITSDIVNLTDDVWNKCQNTESLTIHSEDDAKKTADEYGYHYNDALIGYSENRTVICPTILIKQNNDPWVISGEPELLFAKAYGIIPKVILIKI